MTDRPILFSGPMVRALLAGRKTQTRRMVKGLPFKADRASPSRTMPAHWFTRDIDGRSTSLACPYGVPGERLWVKETHAIVPRTAYAMSDGVQQTLKPGDDHDAAVYAAGWERSKPGRWRPSIHMPRWASRLTLEITDVRVERLQDISAADAEAEGVQDPSLVPILGALWSSRDGYARLWEHINGKGSWAANPWVWAVSFRVES